MPYISIDVSKKLTDEEKMVICKKMGKVMVWQLRKLSMH